MLHKRVRALAPVWTLAFGAFALFAGSAGAASEARADSAQRPKPKAKLYRAVHAGVSPAVRDLRAPLLSPDPNATYEIPNPPDKSWEDTSGLVRRDVATPDGALQNYHTPNVMPTPSANFEGVSQAVQGAVSGFFVNPPDTVGDVGPNHYVQCVNLACRVFNKTGTALTATFTIRSLFAGASFPGDCSTTNDGDPIVLYDPLADRWHLSQFAVSNRPPSHECVAVSQTNDPTGAWYLYDFVIPDNYFNDYPKFGVWPDAYYMTAPLFEGPVFGQGLFIMNRAKMLAGDPTAEMVFFDLTLAEPGLQRLLPADVDGPAPPPGTPNYVVTMAADEYGDPADAYRIFAVHADFNDVDNSTITELPSLPSASFDPTFTEVSGNCGFAFTSRDDIDQPPPANCGMRVDSLSGRPMHRLAYRNFGTHESLIGVQTVDVNATPPTATAGHLAGARYFELRRTLPGGSWTVNEEATYSPDAVHRFMPSAAMDAQGNLAVGYSVSDLTTTFPGIRYAGRLASDPPGGLFQGEATLVPGSNSQTTTNSRWGDYSAMSIDPADDCTFWYTQEYYTNTPPPSCSATACWQTRVGSFKFPSCTSTTVTGTLSGTVTDLATALPLAGALVQANGYTGVSNGSGNYSITLPAGTYSATAGKAGYASASASGIVVPGGGGAVQNFALGSGSLAGVVTDSVSTAPIAGAKVKTNTGVAKFTSGSGNYAMALPAATYSITVTAPGYYNKTVGGLAVGTSGTTAANVALDPAPQIVVTATAIDDSLGNANGAVDFNECFALKLTLTNNGTSAATGINATLGSTTPGVSFTHNTSPYPDLAAGGGTGTNTQVFLLSSPSAAATAGKPIELVLNLSTSSGALTVPFTLVTGGGPTPLSFPATGPVPIPDNNGVGAALNIPVSGFTGVLSKVRVSFRITHTFDGDLVLRLKSPDGTISLLAYQVGGAGAGFGTDCPADANDTTLDDAAATSILDGAAPFVGAFRPQEPLSAFGGKTAAQVNGTWQFLAIDLGPADIGNIECVTLELNGTAVGGGGCYTKGDMNAPNLQTDLLFNSIPTPTNNRVFFMNGVTVTAQAAVTPNAASGDWRIVGADDFSFDDQTDLVFHNQTTGNVEFWLMNGVNRPAPPVPLTGGAVLPLNWILAATGDVNRDGRPDILWRNSTSQKLVIWKMGEGGAPGTQKTGNIIPTPDQAVDGNWQVTALLDINLDGNTDFLWYNTTSGRIVYWLMDANLVRITGAFTNPMAAGDANWKVVAAGDYGTTCTNPARDGQFDIVWRNDTSGNIVFWTMDSAGNRTSGCFTNPFPPPLPLTGAPDAPLDWRVVGPR
jgi:subtilisin-like proprotein convertase family protein